MIEAIIPREGEAAMLRQILTRVPTTLRVFLNDAAITRKLTYRVLREPAVRLYTPVRLDPGGWTITEADPLSEAVYPPVSVVFGGSVGRVYGYCVTVQTTILWAHRIPDDAPFYAHLRGDELKITPRLLFGQRSV